jgi:hypothetical protein
MVDHPLVSDSLREYLQTNKITETLDSCLCQILKEQPRDPFSSIACQLIDVKSVFLVTVIYRMRTNTLFWINLLLVKPFFAETRQLFKLTFTLFTRLIPGKPPLSKCLTTSKSLKTPISFCKFAQSSINFYSD